MTQVVVQKQVEEEDEADEALQEWLHHPVTQKMMQSFRKLSGVQQSHLFSACAKSSDPEVRGNYAKYVELRAMQSMLEKGPG